jgi:predicted phage tail protein
MNKVHLVGDIGDKFGYEWSMNVSNYGEIIRLIDCQREGFRKYLIETEENEIGFVIQRADEYINDESELLLNLNNEDIIITAVPLGAGKDKGKGGFMGTGMGKIIIGVTLIVIGYYVSGTVDWGIQYAEGSKWAAFMEYVGGALITVGTQLTTQGVEQMLIGDIDKEKQEEGYLFDGGSNTILQGQPVPLLYGEMLIAGTPISASMSTNAIPLNYLEYTDRDYTNSNTLYATNYKNAQNAGNDAASTSGGTVTDAYDDYDVEER